VGVLALVFIYLSPIVTQQARMLTFGFQTISAKIGSIESDIEPIFGFDVPMEAILVALQSDAIQLLQPEQMF
jgi:hypothetical protein